MIRKLFFILTLSLCAAAVSGQTVDDILKLSETSPSETARSMGMAGAFGALGGDASALSINPAGIGIYRSSEFTITPGVNFTTNKASYSGLMNKEDNLNISINQLSLIFSSIPLRDSKDGIISTHFGISINKIADFNNRWTMTGNQIASSKLDESVYQLDNNSPNDFAFSAQDALLIVSKYEDDPASGFINAYEYVDNNGDIQWGIGNGAGIDQTLIYQESGNIMEYNFDFGLNYSHKLYAGMALNFNSIHYNNDYQYTESSNINNYVDDYNTYWDGLGYVNNIDYNYNVKTTGFGLNAKFGLIYKPFQALRLGTSFQTPTYYYLTESFSSNLDAEYYNNVEPSNDILESTYYDQNTDYNLTTPFKGTISTALVDKIGIISFDYEYENAANANLQSAETIASESIYMQLLNNTIENTYQAAHTFRGGLEYRLTSNFALRGGYGYKTSPFQSTQLNSNRTTQIISGGFGYRNNDYFFDVAFSSTTQDLVYQLYETPDYISHVATGDIQRQYFKAAFTFGYRF